MVADTNGKMNSVKPTCRQVDLVYSSGTRVRVLMCVSCIENHPNLTTVHQELMHPASHAAFIRPEHRTYVEQHCSDLQGITNVRKI